MVLYLAEDHFLPMVELSATIRVGGIYDPADKIGLASMTGTVLRSGGAGSRSGDEIDQLAEARGMVDRDLDRHDQRQRLPVVPEGRRGPRPRICWPTC